MVDAKTIATYDAKAGDYADLVASNGPDQQLQDFMSLLPTGGHVLDLGCGPAIASAHMRDAGFTAHPVDASAGMVALAGEKYGFDARHMTFDDLDDVAVYDGVWANFSLLHAAREMLPTHLAAIATALRTSGVFHIGMKTGTGSDRDKIDRMYTYVSVPELTGLLETAGFTVLGIDEGSEVGFAGTNDPWVVMRARKVN